MPPERQRRPGGGVAADAVKADRGRSGSAFPPPPQDLPDLAARIEAEHQAAVVSARAALSFSRDLEFATETELAKRMGCSRYYWLRAILKELIDNALDAAEEVEGFHPKRDLRIILPPTEGEDAADLEGAA